jgi:citrate lyase subunit beta / citryl-CoA lyase
MSAAAKSPQTYLFVPGNRPERFAKAISSGADRVILDLEDAVALSDKSGARASVAQWLAQASADVRQHVLIRINADDSPAHADDMAFLCVAQPACVMLPKCESPAQIAAVLSHLPAGASVVALVETARGMLALQAIAAAPGVSRLAFGSLDYMVDLDLPADSLALDLAAANMAVASRAAGLPSPVAGVTPAIDAAQVSEDMLHARSLGFGAKMCIHPTQVAAVTGALAPSAAEVAWALRVLQAVDAAGPEASGAVQLDGKMVDKPVVLRAQRIAAQAASSTATRT